ncbi:MAG: putative capsid protein [Circular genetic element sp.]|nr:MAG: putative capsid protein [Circular genetic element sp.]
MPLSRAKTMPARRAGVDSRMASTAKRAKASRSAGAAAKRQKAAVAKASREVYKAATKAVMSLKEEKYFNVQPDQQIPPAVPTAGGKKVSVAVFSTTENTAPDGSGLTYCGQNIYQMTMLRPFNSTSSPNDQSNHLDGKVCYPSDARVGWQINRNYVRDFPQSNEANGDLVQNCPVRCRVTRVTPKLAAGVTTQIDPDTDLFRDQKGTTYSALGTDFTYSDAEYAQINTQVYTVISDDKFTLTAPWNVTWGYNPANPASYRWTHDVRHPGGSCSKKFVTTHQLTDKKGGSVHYTNPEAAGTLNATTGNRREYIFMHFWYDCADHGGQPALAGPGVVPDDDVIKIHFRPESRFKDA